MEITQLVQLILLIFIFILGVFVSYINDKKEINEYYKNNNSIFKQ